MQKTEPLCCWEGVLTASLHNNESYSIVVCVFVAAGMCLPSRCVAMNVCYDFIILAFERHIAIFIPTDPKIRRPLFSMKQYLKRRKTHIVFRLMGHIGAWSRVPCHVIYNVTCKPMSRQLPKYAHATIEKVLQEVLPMCSAPCPLLDNGSLNTFPQQSDNFHCYIWFAYIHFASRLHK
jgi:hypothetical protein